MRRRGLWIGLSIIVVLVGGTVWAVRATHFTFPPMRTRALPGFDVDIPWGPVDAETKNYGNGRLNVGSIGSLTPFVQVRWEPGGLYDDDQVALANKAVAPALGQEAVLFPITSEIAVPGKNPTRSWAARAGDRTLWTTQIACGVRRVTLTALGGRNAERLHRRVAGGFRCRPDAARERTVGEVPVVFDVGAGWFHQPSADGDLRIIHGSSGLIARPLGSGVDPADLRRVVEAMMPSFKFGDRVGDDLPFRLDVDGEETQGWMTARACPDGGHLLLMALGEPDKRNDTRALLTRARCRRPDEAPQSWPDLPSPSDAPTIVGPAGSAVRRRGEHE